MALRGFAVFAMIWPYILLPLGNAMSCEEAIGQISDKIEQLTLCDSQISTHLADLVQDSYSMRHKNKDIDIFPMSEKISGCNLPSNGSIPNGHVTQVVDQTGNAMLLIKCKNGFLLQGNPVLVCRGNSWDDSLPVCIEKVMLSAHDVRCNGSSPKGQVYQTVEMRFKCNEGFALQGNPTLECRGDSWNGPLPACVAKDCMAHRSAGQIKDGVYTIVPDGQTPKLVYCDMTTDGGGWIIIQRRVDDSVNFYRDYHEYQQGFGDLEGNIWLGLDMIHVLSEPTTELFVDMVANKTHKAFARYDSFSIADETDGYRLSVSGYSGTAGDSLKYHNGQKFTTYDKDQDEYSTGNCAKMRKGAWWYKGCHLSNLNGLYLNGSLERSGVGINWKTFSGYYYSMKHVEMKIRREV